MFFKKKRENFDRNDEKIFMLKLKEINSRDIGFFITDFVKSSYNGKIYGFEFRIIDKTDFLSDERKGTFTDYDNLMLQIERMLLKKRIVKAAKKFIGNIEYQSNDIIKIENIYLEFFDKRIAISIKFSDIPTISMFYQHDDITRFLFSRNRDEKDYEIFMKRMPKMSLEDFYVKSREEYINQAKRKKEGPENVEILNTSNINKKIDFTDRKQKFSFLGRKKKAEAPKEKSITKEEIQREHYELVELTKVLLDKNNLIR